MVSMPYWWTFSPATPVLRATAYLPYPAELRCDLLKLHQPQHNELHQAAMLSQKLARIYADAVFRTLDNAGIPTTAVRAIGCHGQTIRHQPHLGYTIQINNPALLAELTSISVVADFRSRDIAAGGQGAPLVPAFHAALFRDASRHRVIVNIGGIANLTDLKPGQTTGASITVRATCCLMPGRSAISDRIMMLVGNGLPPDKCCPTC